MLLLPSPLLEPWVDEELVGEEWDRGGEVELSGKKGVSEGDKTLVGREEEI